MARRFLDVSAATESLRIRVALAMMIPFGMVVVVREFLSRRALITAGQDLASTREQLVQKEKLAAVGQLVSGVAHELNNPLQGVLGYAELMLAAKPARSKPRSCARFATTPTAPPASSATCSPLPAAPRRRAAGSKSTASSATRWPRASRT